MSAAKLAPFLLAVAGLCGLHLLQKTMPAQANAGAALAVAYVVAMLVCAAAFPFFIAPGQTMVEGLSSVPWNAVAMGFAIAACELGILLTYRAGWPVGSTAVMASAAMTLVLFPLGIAVFGEALTMQRAGGIALTLGGLYLLTK